MTIPRGISKGPYRDLLTEAAARGWNVKQTKGGHLKLTHENGGLIFCSATPSDFRAWRKLSSEIRKQEAAWNNG